MKVSELEGAQLDYWAGQAVGKKVVFDSLGLTYAKKMFCSTELTCWSPSKFWEQGGPFIQQEDITLLHPSADEWEALVRAKYGYEGPESEICGSGPSPLIAICRAVVVSKYGEEVPDAPPAADPTAPQSPPPA